jgi:hypothetical protein
MPLTKPTVYGKASIELARAATNTQMLRITLRVGTQALAPGFDVHQALAAPHWLGEAIPSRADK